MTLTHQPGILVAENEVLIRNLIAAVLSNQGYFVLAAANDAEALELSRTYQGELALLITRSQHLADEMVKGLATTRVVVLSPEVYRDLQQTVRNTAPETFRRQATLPAALNQAIEDALSG